MTRYRNGIALCLAAGLLLTACVPAIHLAVPIPAVQKIACRGIPIGIVIGSSDLTDAVDQQEGYELALQQVNQAGGIQGCQVRLVYDRSEGDGSNPDAVQAAILQNWDRPLADVPSRQISQFPRKKNRHQPEREHLIHSGLRTVRCERPVPPAHHADDRAEDNIFRLHSIKGIGNSLCRL